MAGMTRKRNLRRLLQPRHIAFIGGQDLAAAVRRCEAIGYSGDIWVVNPKHEQIAGRACHASVDDLPAAPDAAFIAVRRDATIAIVRALAARGAGGCVCYAAGFAESGADGAALQAEMVVAAGDMALVGPNCYGVLNYLDGVALFPSPHGGERIERGVAIISQSGNVSLNLTMNDRSVPIAYVVSAGNQAVLGLGDYIETLADDPRVAAIGLYVEGLNDVAGFTRAAVHAMEKGVPIVAVKVGSSELGAQMTLGHTTALSGPEALHDALFERLAIMRVGSLSALLETLKLLAIAGRPEVGRLGVLTASGGDAAQVADLAERAGLDLPALSQAQAAAFGEQLVSYAAISNPLDYNNPLWGDAAGLERCFVTMMEGDFDATLLVLDYPRPTLKESAGWDVSVDALIAARRQTGKPAMVLSTLPESLPPPARDRLTAAGIAPLQGLDEALAALGGIAWYQDRLRQIAVQGGARHLGLPAPAAVPRQARQLDEWDSKRRLAAFGLPVPEGRLIGAAEAPNAAAELGFPVAAKAVGPALVHKTERAAVALNLRCKEAVAQAVTNVLSSTAGIPGAGERVLIERMVDGAVAELIVSVRRDDRFGLALVIGSGGVLVDLVGDARTLLLPTDRPSIAGALDGLKIARLLTGFRGRPAGDREAAIDAALAVAAFAEHHRETLVELDINPLRVLPRGQGAVAVDAFVRMAAD